MVIRAFIDTTRKGLRFIRLEWVGVCSYISLESPLQDLTETQHTLAAVNLETPIVEGSKDGAMAVIT